MTTCPKCGSELPSDFGMVQCPKCGAFSLINMDGEAVIQDAIDPNYGASPEPSGGAGAPSDYADPIESLIDVQQNDVESAPADFGSLESLGSAQGPGSAADFEGSHDSSGSHGDVMASGNANDFMSFDPFAGQSSDGDEGAAAGDGSNSDSSYDSGESSHGNDSAVSDDFEPIDMSPSSAPTPAASSSSSKKSTRSEPSFGPADDPLNLNEFANSEVSSAKDGPILFRVLISGIDSREIRESIREVLEDPRFAWDSNEIFSKVSKGSLAVNGLSPVKASILVTRIKRLPVQIRWEQYAITQGQQN